jgi:hypothetical protein
VEPPLPDGPPPEESPSNPTVAICAMAPKVKSVSETIRARTRAQTRDANRIFKGVPVQAEGSSDVWRRL